MSVFTQVSYDEMLEHLRLYPLGALLGYQGIGEGVENTNYFVDTTDGRWVLTLFERTDASGLPFFIGLMEHLSQRGYPCPSPAHTLGGEALTRLKDRPAVLVRRLTGNSALFPTLDQCAAVGSAIGELHVLAESFQGRRRNERGQEWRSETARALIDKVSPLDAQLVADELAIQSELDLGCLPQGVIHADLFRDNVLFVESRLTGVIDFYYACRDALLYDLAIAVNDWCAEPDGHINRARAKVLIDAYQSWRELSQDEVRAWHLTLRAAAFRFYLSRLQDWHFPRPGDLVHIKEPIAYRRVLESHRSEPPPPLEITAGRRHPHRANKT